LLTPADQDGYLRLREGLHVLAVRIKRAQLATHFVEIVTRIREYCVRRDQDDWKRSLVCGLLWLSDDSESDPAQGAFALSTRQLCKLVGRCKSSVNAGFQSLGYVTTPISLAQTSAFLRALPFMRNSMEEMRQWTVRGPVPGCRGMRFAIAPRASEGPESLDRGDATAFDGAYADRDECGWLDGDWGDGFLGDVMLDL
jgi:hypothetical protein